MDFVEECLKGEKLVDEKQQEYNSKKNLYNIYSNRKKYLGTLLNDMKKIVGQLDREIAHYNKLHLQVDEIGLQLRFSMIVAKLKEIKQKYEVIINKHKNSN